MQFFDFWGLKNIENNLKNDQQENVNLEKSDTNDFKIFRLQRR